MVYKAIFQDIITFNPKLTVFKVSHLVRQFLRKSFKKIIGNFTLLKKN